MVARLRVRVWRALRRMTSDLPRRAPAPGQDWGRFLTLAESSRSAAELLAAVLHRPVSTRLVRNEVLTVRKPLHPLQLADGEHPVRVLEHELVDPRRPHPPLGLTSALLVATRLPTEVRGPARRGQDTLTTLLDHAGTFWSAQTEHIEQLTAAHASYATGRAADVPVVRLTRLLHLLTGPVAVVIDELPQPLLPPAAAHTPPTTPPGARDPPA